MKLKWSQNGAEMSQNELKIVPKWNRNASKIALGGPKELKRKPKSKQYGATLPRAAKARKCNENKPEMISKW